RLHVCGAEGGLLGQTRPRGKNHARIRLRRSRENVGLKRYEGRRALPLNNLPRESFKSRGAAGTANLSDPFALRHVPGNTMICRISAGLVAAMTLIWFLLMS